MVNSWSLLYDELKMSENFESTYKDSIPKSKDYTALGGSNSSDTISFGNTYLPGGMYNPSQDYWDYDGISFTGNPYASPDVLTMNSYNIKMNENTNANGFWKYNEDKILKQLEHYISGTYNQHYVDRTGGGTEQTLDKIKHNRREGFCAGNVTKYIDRYDTKGTPRADLFKVLHYTILLINHLNLIENK
jgi:hypothetical protein